MSKYWSELASSLTPYIPGEQPQDKKVIKLNTNENPYPPSSHVLDAIKAASDSDLRLYPDPNCTTLRQTIAAYHGLREQQVFVGNGSDEILALAFAALFKSTSPISFPDITYSFYKVYAQLYNLRYELIPLDDEFNIPLDQIHRPNGGIIIPNPNAPTGKGIAVGRIEQLVAEHREQVVIIDEAYIDFGGESAVQLIKRYPNVLVVHTLSKSRSLAGLRVGVALGHEELIEGLNRVKNSFNSYTLDRLAIAGAVAAYQDEAHFIHHIQKVIHTRERTVAQLRTLGFKVIDSQANFVCMTHVEFEAETLYLALRERGILVRHFNESRIHNYLRVSIGTDSEMDSFIEALTQLLRV
ncbi:histidinol-phosphate transaminase [Paenibacillus sp. 481]|uniref:histidinol-phosphate transaminase n=1 Tax=Paenibacillus sp. 481 TaxID=2835869 RepID=UPI001E636C50|nr:histidinol-phosphate transaminase [Paenibacillus sp. 481]UHA73790.1 histidinol-phosphate transaminase [Paenibacillus sp. 481]